MLEKSNNIIIDEDLVTSKGEFDYGSTFNNLHCKNCNEWLVAHIELLHLNWIMSVVVSLII